MKLYFALFSMFLFTAVGFSQKVYERNLMMKEFNKGYLKESFVKDFHPYATIKEREFWNNLPSKIKENFIKEAEQYLNKDWTFLPATEYLLYAQNGNRTIYEAKVFARWSRLSTEVMAEVIENRGRFMNDILNGIWSICEESSWCWPAHISMQKAGVNLADVTEPIIDLGCGEISAKLAWISYLMPDKLDSLSPLIRKRIDLEVHKRFLDQLLTHDAFGWYARSVPNNWDPWIMSNYLACIFILEKDDDKKLKEINKTCLILDKFINGYADDGGCDEGPGYYSHAGACMFDCLDILSQATDRKFNLYNETVIKNMASYILKTHIDDHYYTNFADASALLDYSVYSGLIYRFGECTGNKDMMAFAAYQNKLPEKYDADKRFLFGHRMFRNLKYIKEVEQQEAKAPYYQDAWLESIQVMTTRTTGGSPKGLYLAAQGGHNEESHNHNDVGNFIIYVDGQPAIIDAGVGVYTRKTFSPERYTIWTMQSQYHNCPSINGIQQSPGMEYKATGLIYNATKDITSLYMNIATAYPKEAEIKSWNRSLILNRSKNRIEIKEDYELSKFISSSTINLMCSNEPVIKSNGTIEWTGKEGMPLLKLTFNSKQVEPAIETIKMDDEKLSKAWGDKVYRIVLKIKDPVLKNHIEYYFTQLSK